MKKNEKEYVYKLKAQREKLLSEFISANDNLLEKEYEEGPILPCCLRSYHPY